MADPEAARWGPMSTLRSRWFAIAVFAIVVAAAAFLRFYDLATNPGGLYGDEAAEGLDALRMLHQPGFHPDFLVWFQSDGGREALFAYAVSLVFRFFGESTLILRATAAGFGVAGVIGIAWLARRWGTWPAIVAGAWAAGSLWLVCVSRDGMRNTIVPLFGALALIAILRWAARPGRGSAALAGAAASVAALYTYQPLKLVPLLVALWLLWLWHANRERFSELRGGIGAFAVSFVAVGAPMLAVAVTNPLNYFGRATAVSTFNPDVVADANFPIHIVRTIGMFGYFGDGNGRHDVASLPLLPLPLVVLAVLGVLRLWRSRREPAEALILLSLPVFMIPPLLATEGYSPHFLRVLGLAAPLAVTVALGTAEFVEIARRKLGGTGAAAAIGLAAASLCLVAVSSGLIYFNRSLADRYVTFTYDLVAAADEARIHPGSALIVYDYAAYDVDFLDYDRMPTIVKPGSTIEDPTKYTEVIALNKDDLSRALGPELGGTATPIAWDPSGQPTVWVVVISHAP